MRALACYGKALKPARNYPEALGNYFYLRLNACDWRDYATLRDTIITGVASGNKGYSVLPFIAVSDSAQLQLCCARVHVSHNHPAAPTPLVTASRRQRDKIKIAYLSGDLREHAVSYLAAGLFAMHDRHRFEVSAISLAPCPDNEIGHRLRHSFDTFIEVQQLTDRKIAVRIRDLGIDILIDLMGFTRSCRPNILAFRPAPIQVNYLGFLATMGATYIDYIIADDYVIPSGSRDGYQEKAVSLPDCFQVNDSQRFLPGGNPARTLYGLPESCFVFCCFNNSNKITPPVFDCWMRLMKAHTDSVFWLIANDERSRANLRKEAEQRGVNPARLVFAERMPYHAHLQLTCSGEAFASRMAGSLLRACGLNQLITHTMADYETLALRLANNPDELRNIRDTLVAQRTTGSLFNTQRFCRHLESAFITMIDTLEQGKPPKSFSVAAETESG